MEKEKNMITMVIIFEGEFINGRRMEKENNIMKMLV